jgi:hypothetical protein
MVMAVPENNRVRNRLFTALKAAYTRTAARVSYHFLLNNQPDALIIQIHSAIKLYMFRASSLPIIRSFLLYIRHCLSFMQVSDDRFRRVK